MNPDKIFHVFNEKLNQEEDNKLAEDFKNHPIVKIGMFKKIIKNYLVLGDKILSLFMLPNMNLNEKEVKIAGEYMVYYRAWENIKDIDLENQFHLDNLKLSSNEEFIIILDSIIKYFEKHEEYTKCAFLFSIQEKVKEFLK